MAIHQYHSNLNCWIIAARSRAASYRRANVSSLRRYGPPSTPSTRRSTVAGSPNSSQMNGRAETRADQGKSLTLSLHNFEMVLPNFSEMESRLHVLPILCGGEGKIIHLTNIYSFAQDIYPLQGRLFTNLLCLS